LESLLFSINILFYCQIIVSAVGGVKLKVAPSSHLLFSHSYFVASFNNIIYSSKPNPDSVEVFLLVKLFVSS